MQENRKPLIPPSLLVLDLLGGVLLALGILKHSRGVDVIPVEFGLGDYGPTFIVVGIAFTVPAVVHIIRRPKAQTRGKQL